MNYKIYYIINVRQVKIKKIYVKILMVALIMNIKKENEDGYQLVGNGYL